MTAALNVLSDIDRSLRALPDRFAEAMARMPQGQGYQGPPAAQQAQQAAQSGQQQPQQGGQQPQQQTLLDQKLFGRLGSQTTGTEGWQAMRGLAGAVQPFGGLVGAAAGRLGGGMDWLDRWIGNIDRAIETTERFQKAFFPGGASPQADPNVAGVARMHAALGDARMRDVLFGPRQRLPADASGPPPAGGVSVPPGLPPPRPDAGGGVAAPQPPPRPRAPGTKLIPPPRPTVLRQSAPMPLRPQPLTAPAPPGAKTALRQSAPAPLNPQPLTALAPPMPTSQPASAVPLPRSVQAEDMFRGLQQATAHGLAGADVVRAVASSGVGNQTGLADLIQSNKELSETLEDRWGRENQPAPAARQVDNAGDRESPARLSVSDLAKAFASAGEAGSKSGGGTDDTLRQVGQVMELAKLVAVML